MNSTPAMCHQAEIEFSNEVRRTSKKFTPTAISITTEYVTKIQCELFG